MRNRSVALLSCARSFVLRSLLFLLLLVAFAPAAAQAQCPMCRAALEQSEEGRRLARGFNDGILFLLAAPFLVVGTVGVLVYRARRLNEE